MVRVKPTSKISIILLICLFLTGVFSSCTSHGKQESIGEYQPVSAARVTTGTIEHLEEYSGIVKPHSEAYIVSSIPGKVSDIYYEIGDRVSKGDILFTIESAELEDSIRILEEQLKVAASNVSLAENGVLAAWGSQYESQRLQLESALVAAENNYIAAKIALDEYTFLFEAGQISKQQYQEVKNRYEQASDSLNSARSAYELYVNRLSKDTKDNADDKLKQAKASYEVIKNQLESARKKLELTNVNTPLTGIINDKNIIKGSLISPEIVAYTVVNVDPALIVFSVTEQVINKIKKGDKVTVEIPSASSRPFIGRVTLVSPSVDERTLTYMVGVEIENKKNLIKPGMSARVGIKTDKHQNTVIVPMSSVLNNEGETYVFLYKEGKAVRTLITTGLSDARNVEVTNGIKKGDILIIKGHQYLKDQDLVKIIGEGGQS